MGISRSFLGLEGAAATCLAVAATAPPTNACIDANPHRHRAKASLGYVPTLAARDGNGSRCFGLAPSFDRAPGADPHLRPENRYDVIRC